MGHRPVLRHLLRGRPPGRILAEATEDRDELVVADLDMFREVRDLWQFFRDRRLEMYGDLTELRAADSYPVNSRTRFEPFAVNPMAWGTAVVSFCGNGVSPFYSPISATLARPFSAAAPATASTSPP